MQIAGGEKKPVKWQQQQIDLKKKCKYLQLMYKIESDFVPGRPGTEEFVPGHLLLPLSRDKGTGGQAKLFCPGTKGQRDVPSLGNPSLDFTSTNATK